MGKMGFIIFIHLLFIDYHSYAMTTFKETDVLNGFISLTQRIDSLEQLKKIAPTIVKTCKTTNKTTTDRYDFSNIEVKLNPKVFDQYIKEKNFMEKQRSINLNNRLLCHFSNRENQLKIAQKTIPHEYKEWSKMLIIIYGNQQKLLTNEEDSLIDYDTFQNEHEKKEGPKEHKSDSDNEYNENLLSQLNEANKKNERLEAENRLNNLLSDFIMMQQYKEEKSARWKERLFQVVLIIATGLGTYYGSSHC